MDQAAPELSVVIPALNEEKTIGLCIRKIFKAAQNLGPQVRFEVLVADNGSTDKTIEIARSLGARVIPVYRRGYGQALMAGFQAARGKYLIMADADDSYNFEELAPFYHKLREGDELVMGNRFKGKIEKGAMPFLHRCLGTPVLTAIMNLFFRTGIGDVNCGMRGMNKEAYQRMRLRAGGMEFATEMIVKASLLKMKISEVPCNLYKDKRGRKPHLRPWQDGWRHLRFQLLFTPTWTFLIPGLLTFTIGTAGMSLLFFRDIFAPEAFQIITQKHMLSLMLLLLTGYQIMQLGMIAKAFSFSKHFDHGSPIMLFLSRYFSLERGILLGFFLAAVSLMIFIYLPVSLWTGWLPRLSDLIRLDLAIFAITFFLMGVQMIFSSFVLSLFYLKVK